MRRNTLIKGGLGAVLGVLLLIGASCGQTTDTTTTDTSQGVPYAGVWTESDSQEGVTSSISMSFVDGKYEWDTTLELSPEMAEQLAGLDEEGAEETNGAQEVETNGSLNITSDYSEESGADGVYNLVLSNFTWEATGAAMAAEEEPTPEELSSEIGKLTVDTTTEGQITIYPTDKPEEPLVLHR
ncbi:MAG: hypothetical protein Q8P90_04865 [bacterium]|nr:hypothetical protein [bacterium]